MPQSIRVTVLVENTAFGRDVWAEHGLSFWIESGSKRMLFDTGQSTPVLRHNADVLGIDLASADAVVLSHGHYDHTGGLADVLQLARGAALFLHPGAHIRRYSRKKEGAVQEIGMPPPLDHQSLATHASSIHWTQGPTQVAEGVSITGAIPRINNFEDTGGDFYLDGTCHTPDPIEDDQALFLDTAEGTVVILGCAHAGVVNTLHHVRGLTGGRPIHGVLGGMHLVTASQDRLDRTVGSLRGLDLGLLAPAHCTGARAQVRLGSEFPEGWEPCHVGSRFEFVSPTRPEPA